MAASADQAEIEKLRIRAVFTNASAGSRARIRVARLRDLAGIHALSRLAQIPELGLESCEGAVVPAIEHREIDLAEGIAVTSFKDKGSFSSNEVVECKRHQ